MSFIRRIFSKKAEEDYETILSNLANDIQNRQVKLSELRLRERRSTLVVTLYTLAAWGAYVSLWYLDALPDLVEGGYIRSATSEKMVKVSPVAIGPIMILFIRRVVQIWYKRKGDAEGAVHRRLEVAREWRINFAFLLAERTLKDLMKKRRDKVEEIKKKTNYYSTRDLIQKYDDATPAATPLRQRFPPNQSTSLPPATPIRARPGAGGPQNGNSVPQTPMPSAGLQAHLSPSTPAYAIAPPRKQWYDKLADALLGDDDPAIASPSSRYALICEKCFAHNGLVKESLWEDTQYTCPKCGHFNASARSKKANPRQSVSPPTPSAALPSHTTTAQQHQHSLSPDRLKAGSKESDGDSPTVDSTDTSAMEIDPADADGEEGSQSP